MEIYPTGLPVAYDFTDPASNLAFLGAYDETILDGIVPDVLKDNRFLWGAEVVPAYFAGLYGYKRHGSVLGGLAWALAGYMAPLPVVALAAYESTTQSRLF